MESTSPKSSSTPVLDLLRDPKRWHKGSLFQNKHGNICLGSHACSYCLLGAVAVSYEELTDRRTACNKITSLLSTDISQFNDDPNTTHADIIKVLEKAKV